MVVKNISNPITPPESPNSKASPKSTGLSSSGLNSFDRFMRKNKKKTPSLSGLTLSSGTNSFDRFMKKNKNKKPSSSLLNREMNIVRGKEIIKLKNHIEYLNNVIKERVEDINRLHNWNVYSNTKPALCNKRIRQTKGSLKKLSKNKKNSKKLTKNKKNSKKLTKNKKSKVLKFHNNKFD